MPLLDTALLAKQLRLDDDQAQAEAELLTLYLGAAEQAAANYMGRQLYPAGDSVPDTDAYGIALDNQAIVGAILLHAAQLFEYREAISEGAMMELPLAYAHLLGPYRILFPEL